jgi:hypothetical protein
LRIFRNPYHNFSKKNIFHFVSINGVIFGTQS